jgi:hypothetical protein
VTLTAEQLALARNPDRYAWLSDDVTRFADGRVCVIQGAHWASVSGVRVAGPDVEMLVDEVRALVPAEKHMTWWLDDETEPADLVDRLKAHGLRDPADRGLLVHALACTTAPPASGNGGVVTRVESYEDWLAAVEVMWEAFSTTDERREQHRPHLRSEFDAAQRAGVPVTFLARLDGRPAGVGRSVYADHGVFLIAGSVADWARRRGVYTALVRARWDDAVARGTPCLVTDALPDTSYPILKRLGFEDIATIRRLEDPREPSPS